MPADVPPGYPPPGDPREPGTTPPVPGPPPPGWGQPAGPPPRQWLPAVHRPGIVPLAPFGLGDVLGGAFKLLRLSPAAALGSAALASVLAGLVPVLVTALVSGDGSLDLIALDTAASGTDPFGDVRWEAWAAVGLSAGFGFLVMWVGYLLVQGMVAVAVERGLLGVRTSLAQAWAGTAGTRLRLVGLSLLLGLGSLLLALVWLGPLLLVVALADDPLVPALLWGLLGFVLWAVASVFAWVRLALVAVPALVLERRGVLSALGRAWSLTRGAFWRTLGIAILVGLITSVVASVVSFPVTLVLELLTYLLDPRWTMLLLVLGQVLSQVVAGTLSVPFQAAATTLQYVDLRIRRDGWDLELLQRAGLTGPVPTAGVAPGQAGPPGAAPGPPPSAPPSW
ncbi:hypothetical protein [Nocardioides bruguierae]|uniref:hypothetical protein n=1 Tax=Nocardioides bruguierae TaxID=2945102 RepID=UPI0020218785|nr:hypothetical protein [Nocardioides bruguierae]MCL8024194.1 hypothetical protein [Nocardioides bruguierae]